VLRELDEELIGLAPVKQRIRETAALLAGRQARAATWGWPETPTLHMSFTGNPGTGKTTVALKMAGLLHRLGYVRKGHLVTVTRDDLVGQYIGHTAPKTKEVLKKAMGGVLFIDEAYYLYKPDNERDYGQEAIEILLQVMENNRDDLVVIMAGYADRMDKFFAANPGFRSRIAHHIDFPDYTDAELLRIAASDADTQNYASTTPARRDAFEYIAGAPQPAAFRQCAFDPQRARPGAAAPGQPAVSRPPIGRSTRGLQTIGEAPDISRTAAFSAAGLMSTASHEGESPMTLTAHRSRLRRRSCRPTSPISGRDRGGGRGAGCRLGPSRCDGRAFRAQHDLRPARSSRRSAARRPSPSTVI
jgi:probable Rubsico expression protein CbbX